MILDTLIKSPYLIPVTTRSLTDELKQSRPFPNQGAEAVIAVIRTAHLLRRRIEAVVASEDLTHQQYNVLRILRGARGPLPVMEIAERMIEPSCGITRLLTTLEDKKFVKREQWAGDRRQYLCQITPSGLRALERLDDALAGVELGLVSGVSSEDLSILIEALGRMRGNADL